MACMHLESVRCANCAMWFSNGEPIPRRTPYDPRPLWFPSWWFSLPPSNKIEWKAT